MPKRDPLRHHRAHRNEQGSLPERLAGRLAEAMGTWQFLAVALFLIGGWLLLNGASGFVHTTLLNLQQGKPYDQPPWIMLNLIFSFEAFFTGSLVVIAQRRQERRDRAREEADAKHREEIAQEHSRLIEQNTELTWLIHQLVDDIHRRIH